MKKGYKVSIKIRTQKNAAFRKVLYTGQHVQLVLMSLRPGEDIGLEVHTDGDQFFRFESGEGWVHIGPKRYRVRDGDAVVVPAGAAHNIVNTSTKKPLRLYTLYAPPHHRDGVVRATKKAASTSSPEFNGKTSE